MSQGSLLSLQGISKQYPAVLANDRISLEVMPGQIHAILGENGAGKSTLMKIIYGAVQPDQGEIQFQGQVVHIRNPQQARQLGISMVFQHFSLFGSLTVAENVWLGLARRPGLDEVTQHIRQQSLEYGLDVDPVRPVHTLSVGEMQRVEIIRALLTQPNVDRVAIETFRAEQIALADEASRRFARAIGVGVDEQMDHAGDVLFGAGQPVLQCQEVIAHVLGGAGNEAQHLGDALQHGHLLGARGPLLLALVAAQPRARRRAPSFARPRWEVEDRCMRT